ncbi:phage antirepressor N-terminal domain-containing protein, partial [Acinetobacter baumannii]
DLVIIEFNNQPFTAMRPIVEGMGLTWQSQYEKLKQRFSSVITEIVTTDRDLGTTSFAAAITAKPYAVYNFL